MRHIVSVLLENEAGALSRVSGLFSARGYNIESLTVAPTDDETVSRITVVTDGSEEIIQQIEKQLNKLIDVVKVLDLTEYEHVEREILLLKLRAAQSTESVLETLRDKYAARIVDHSDDTFIIEITGAGGTLDQAIASVPAELVHELVRSGASGISAGNKILKPELK